MLLNCGVGEDSRVPCTARRLKKVSPQGNQSWIFVEKTDAEAEASIFWPPDVNSLLIGKDSDAGKDWRQEKGMTEDEMVGWHHRFDGHEFEQALGAGDGQGGLVCYSPWGRKESDTAEQLNWSEHLVNILWSRNLFFFSGNMPHGINSRYWKAFFFHFNKDVCMELECVIDAIEIRQCTEDTQGWDHAFQTNIGWGLFSLICWSICHSKSHTNIN